MTGVRIAAFLALLAAPIAAAQIPLSQIIKDLDAPEARTRIDATEALFRDRSISLKTIEKTLREDQLSPEQRQRLLAVAARRFRAEPRAAMGIKNDGNLGSHGVSLSLVQQNFPAAKVLKVGDRVIAAAGTNIDTWETMRAVIVSRDPGDEIPVTVVREGATLNLTVTLGDFGSLQQPALDPGLLSEAWALRSKPLNGPLDEQPIDSGLPAIAWASQHSLLPDEAADLGFSTQRPGAEPALGLVAGGEPRGGLLGVIQPPVVQRGGFRTIPNRANPGNVDPAIIGLQQQVMVLRSLLQDRLAERASVEQLLLEPGVDGPRRQSLKLRMDSLSQQITKLNDELMRLDTQLNPRPIR